MKSIINPRPEIDESLIKPFRDMEDVLSLSCVVSDALERDHTMRYDMKPRAADKKIIGPAITVKLTAGDIVDCLCVFDVAKPGDVVVLMLSARLRPPFGVVSCPDLPKTAALLAP